MTATKPIYCVLFARDARWGWSTVPKAECFRFENQLEYQRGLLNSIGIAIDWLQENVPKDKYASYRSILGNNHLTISKQLERRLRFEVIRWAEELKLF